MRSGLTTGLPSARMVSILCFAAILGLNPPVVLASEFSERGIKLFMENKPQEAVAVLEAATKEQGADEKLFLYLGIAYQQLGKWDESIASFRKGLAKASSYKHQFLFNIANSFYAQGRNAFALEYYDQALVERSDYTQAYLNRANAKMRLGDHGGAVADYSLYLSLDPGSAQAAEIRRLIELLGSRAAEADRQKAEAEARKLAEEQARQALLDEVTRSLLEAAEATTNLSAGSGDVQGYDTELSLDD